MCVCAREGDGSRGATERNLEIDVWAVGDSGGAGVGGGRLVRSLWMCVDVKWVCVCVCVCVSE